MESIRQKQVAKTIQIALSEIFQREAHDILEGSMVTVSGVHITPDLYTARIYISIFNHPKPDEILGYINFNKKHLRGLLGNKIKKKVRRIPELEFFKDDTLDEVFKLEKIFQEVKSKDAEIARNRGEENADAYEK
jgi:ribosome-binding factor A